VDDTLIYLEMIGAKQSVKANWAALVSGGKVHWLGRKRIHLDGMKEHVKIQVTLPCGWANHILIHKQASLKEMNPEQPFYLLDDGTRPALSESKWPIPPLFYPMLNKCLALPLLPEWGDICGKTAVNVASSVCLMRVKGRVMLSGGCFLHKKGGKN
jgi:hypothetical protein